MALDFGKAKPEQQFREELRILATQIETINQQLGGGSIGGAGPGTQKAFSDMNTKLVFIYEYLKTLQNDIKAENKASMDEVQKSVNGTLQKNLPDIYNQLQELQKAVKSTQAGGTGSTQDIEDIKSTLRELIKVYKEEVTVFRQQNEFLQKKLVDIEKRLGQLER